VCYSSLRNRGATPGMVNGLFEDKSINRAEEDAPCLRYYG
jgi:hypothetical protein